MVHVGSAAEVGCNFKSYAVIGLQVRWGLQHDFNEMGFIPESLHTTWASVTSVY